MCLGGGFWDREGGPRWCQGPAQHGEIGPATGLGVSSHLVLLVKLRGSRNPGPQPGQASATDRDGDGHRAHREDGPPHGVRGRAAGAWCRERADPAGDVRHEAGRHQHQHDGGAGRRARFPGPGPEHARHGEAGQHVAGQRETGSRPGQGLSAQRPPPAAPACRRRAGPAARRRGSGCAGPGRSASRRRPGWPARRG